MHFFEGDMYTVTKISTQKQCRDRSPTGPCEDRAKTGMALSRRRKDYRIFRLSIVIVALSMMSPGVQ